MSTTGRPAGRESGGERPQARTRSARHATPESLLDAWRAALLRIRVPALGQLEISPAPVGKVAGVFPESCGAVELVSAWNPGGEALPLEVNLRRGARLGRLLRRDGVESWSSVGFAPDRVWFEVGRALPSMARCDALELGRDLGQLAIYEWSPGALCTYSCATGEELTRTGWRSASRRAAGRIEVPR